MNIKKIIDRCIDDEIEVEYYNESISLEDIRAFEKEIGFSLPKEYVEFCTSQYLPLAIEVKEEIWEEPGCGDMGPAWTFMNGFFFNSFSTTIHEDFYIPTLSREFKASSEVNGVVFMNEISDQDPYCFLEDQKIYQFDRSGYELFSFEESFLEFFEIELKDLMQRKEAYKKWKKDSSITAPISIRYDSPSPKESFLKKIKGKLGF